MGISNHSIRFSASLAALFLFVGGIGSVHAETEVAATAGPDRARLAKSVDHAVEFLGKSQAEDGSYSSQAGPGITAIVATSLVRSGGSADDPVVAKALKYLDGFVHDDGGIYAPGSRYQNYETSLAILAYHAANSDGRYDER
ncbi:MAG: hypothetical protein AB7U97_15295, partial [Pirellulales bacterium]